MRKLTLFAAIFFMTNITALAQLDLDAGINQGYEWNIFKNPQTVVDSSDTLQRNQLWQNSIYNEVFVESDYYKDWGESRLKLSADASTNLYYQQTQANLFEYRLMVSYRSNYMDNRYIELAPEFERERQDGIDRTDLVFSSRLSYYQFRAPLHLDFYLGDRTWLKFEGLYRHKIYDRFDNEQTKYNAYHLEGLYKKEWRSDFFLNRELQFISDVSYRDQTNTDFPTQDDPLDIDNRTFTKAELGTNLVLETKNENVEIEFPVTGTMFFDHPSANLNYSEIEFGADVDFKIGRVAISTRLERTIRDFKNFEVESGNTLYYGYWDVSAEVEVPITDIITLNSRIFYTTRSSTRERLTTAFYRAYTNSYVQTGITIDLQ